MSEWSARSSELTPLDFFLLGYLRNKVYQTKPVNIQNLKNRITAEKWAITLQMFENIKKEFYKRMGCCQEIEVAHFEHLIHLCVKIKLLLSTGSVQSLIWTSFICRLVFNSWLFLFYFLLEKSYITWRFLSKWDHLNPGVLLIFYLIPAVKAFVLILEVKFLIRFCFQQRFQVTTNQREELDSHHKPIIISSEWLISSTLSGTIPQL